jgi:hypothetical protein
MTIVARICARRLLRFLTHLRNEQSCGNSLNVLLQRLPSEFVPPISLNRFCEITGLSKTSTWRYEKRGWLRTHLIANRRYILAADVAEFNRRLASDEFAKIPSKSLVPRSLKRNNS